MNISIHAHITIPYQRYNVQSQRKYLCANKSHRHRVGGNLILPACEYIPFDFLCPTHRIESAKGCWTKPGTAARIYVYNDGKVGACSASIYNSINTMRGSPQFNGEPQCIFHTRLSILPALLSLIACSP